MQHLKVLLRYEIDLYRHFRAKFHQRIRKFGWKAISSLLRQLSQVRRRFLADCEERSFSKSCLKSAQCPLCSDARDFDSAMECQTLELSTRQLLRMKSCVSRRRIQG